jgi:hypothetical protein
MTQLDISVKQLFDAFVYYRQQGASPDFSLGELRKLRPVITQQERDELVSYVRTWEMSEGQNFPPDPTAEFSPWIPDAAVPSHIKKGTKQLSTDTLKEFGTGQIRAIIFLVKGYEHAPITVDLTSKNELIVGRAHEDAVLLPDIDLSVYGAEEQGVSRVHAAIKYHNHVVTLSDMGSVNHTYLNGVMLHPQEVRVVPEGSEIRLGNLYMRPTYKR